MLRGGLSDKLGNAYEALWTLTEALHVLCAQADEIRLEPFNEDGGGLEFRVTTGGLNVWHQCKSRRNDGRWTIPNLVSAGVLDDFARKLMAPENGVVFVSSDPAADFERLAQLAEKTDTPDIFAAALNQDDQTNILKLPATWPDDLATKFAWLRRVRVETVSEDSLRRNLTMICGLLFTAGAETALDRLASHLDRKTTQTITTETFRADIEALNLGWHARLDPTLGQAITEATNAYLKSLPAMILGGEISTPQLTAAIETALNPSGRLIMVSGGAGSGKSVALARAVREARERGYQVLALRIDQFLDKASAAEIGNALLSHARSPVALLGNSLAGRDCLLVIDQVDAVSERSGRTGRIRDVLFQMVEEARFYPGMRLVLAARRYDLDHDSRLQDLEGSPGAVAVPLTALDWGSEVEPLLSANGLRAERLSERQRAILRIPVNLQIYLTLIAAGERVEGDLSGVRLFDLLVDLRARQFAAMGVTWTPQAALGRLARWMSQAQELAAPATVIADLPLAADLLSSNGLLVRTGDRLQFAHESFFDHSFSADFVSSGESVHGLLTAAQQGLFRRTQVRQIFARLRAQGGRPYLANLRQVMDAQDVRYLVKDAVATWLSDAHSPTRAELALVEEWYARGGAFEPIGRLILNGSAWLPLLIQEGLIGRLIEQGEKPKSLALWLLKKGSVEHQTDIARFLRQWWGGRADRTAELRDWFARLYPDADIGDLAEVYRDVIAATSDAAINNKFEQNFDLGAWAHKDRVVAAKVLAWWLDRWLKAFPKAQPFGRHGENNWRYWLKEIVGSDQEALLEAVWPAFVESLARDRHALASGEINYPELRPPFGNDDSDWIVLIRRALSATAAASPDKVGALLDALPTEGELPLQLVLDAIAANGAALHGRLSALMDRPEIFDIGESGGKWRPFADAARAAFPFLSQAERAGLEARIMTHRPELASIRRAFGRSRDSDTDERARNRDFVAHRLGDVGKTEWAILSTLGPDQLSPGARSRLLELNRKFHGQPLPEAYGIRGGFVRSPIDLEKTAKMTDAQWLSAFARYAGGERHIYLKDEVVGGAEQLAMMLQAQAKSDPGRFVALLERAPADANIQYVVAIVRGVREGASGDTADALALRLFRATARWDRNAFVRELFWLVRQYPSVAQDRDVMTLLIGAATFGEAADDHVRTMNPREPTQIQDLLDGGDVEASGINSERGVAWEALGAVLWDDESKLAEISRLLTRRIEFEPLTSVRMSMYRAINSMVKFDVDLGLELLRRLANKDLSALQSNHGRHVLRWASWNYPDAMHPVLDALVSSDDDGLRALGLTYRAARSLGDETEARSFLDLATDDVLARRICAFVATRNLKSDRIGDTAAAWLVGLFNDPDSRVRDEASQIGWLELLDGDADRSELVRAFLTSATFNDDPEQLMHALGERVDRFAEITFDAIRRVLELKDAWAQEGGHRAAGAVYHLGQTLIALYRACEGDEVREARLLDLFDEYLAADLHEMRAQISEYERL